MKLNERRRSHLRRGEEKGRRGREKRSERRRGGEEEKRRRGRRRGEKRRGEEGETRGRGRRRCGGGVGVAVYIGKFRRNYRRHLIDVGAINFRR